MGLEDVCQGIFFCVVVVGGCRGAVLWWGSRLVCVCCMNGWMEWEGIYMLLTAGYSIDIIDLVGMSFLFDYPL